MRVTYTEHVILYRSFFLNTHTFKAGPTSLQRFSSDC